MNPSKDPNSNKYPDRTFYKGKWMTPDQIEAARAYNRNYSKSEAARARSARYRETEKFRATTRRYRNSEKGRETIRAFGRDWWRLNK